ncbi:MAG: SH3 domain-containing protein [Deltaproteobacteria bacterium]|nr:SH3 domain-containing protein [Deltaproteobacteria bacterium]
MSPKAKSKKGDKIEVVKVLIIAVVSFVLGFALVILFLRPKPPSSPGVEIEAPIEAPIANRNEGSAAPTEASGGGYAPSGSGGGYAPQPAANQVDTGQKSDGFHEGEAPAEVPPGRTPDGVAADGAGFYLKCWDENGAELPGESCDRLKVLEKRFSTRLYVVDRCKKKQIGDKAEGKLSLGVEVDFGKMSLSFWNGASSNIEGAGKIATCLRTELAGLPIRGFDHKYQRYRIFFTVLFGKAAEKASAKTPTSAASAPPKGKGKLVNVVKDRVRVRKTPVDGDIIGKISAGNQVRLLDKKAGWCHIITPNNNEGWMICDALGK